MARPKNTQPAAPRVAQAPKKISLDKFRSWLEGVEEMQAEDWTPTPEQWQRIRAKIDEIVDSSPGRVNRYDEDHGGVDLPPRGPIRQAAPSAFAAPANMAPVAPPLVVEEGPGAVSAPGVKSTGTKIKTPNIDTSQGGYQTSFE